MDMNPTTQPAARFLDDVAEIIASAPNGIPIGHIYAMLAQWLSLPQFEGFIAALIATGKVKRRGDLLTRS